VKVVYLPPAREELLRATRYYAQRAHGLRTEFLSAIRSAERTIVRFPESKPRVRGEIRRALLHKFPYSILYSIRGQMLVVIAVMHERRRPDYWLSRTDTSP
jgi:plasmid stabilization system protein ParE